jgi:hypothetical protein
MKWNVSVCVRARVCVSAVDELRSDNDVLLEGKIPRIARDLRPRVTIRSRARVCV